MQRAKNDRSVLRGLPVYDNASGQAEPGRFGPDSFRLWVALAKFGGSFRPDFFLMTQVWKNLPH